MDISVFGNPGTVGVAATVPGTDGGPGGPGQSVVADASQGADASSTASAYGGVGGNGGAGGSGNPGGTGGNGGAGGDGGNAKAAATGHIASTTTDATAEAGAIGGDAGNHGSPGFGQPNGVGGEGGNGGTAGATADATNIAGAAFATATSQGGKGSLGDGTGFAGGDGGIASGTTATAVGLSIAHATVTQRGGDGGGGSSGADGGSGAGSSLVNAVSAITNGGSLSLSQTAIGGAGGVSDTGPAGTAGSALSDLTFDDTTNTTRSARVTIVTQATGGTGGNADFSPSTGGDGSVTAVITTAASSLTVSGLAYGGKGGTGIQTTGAAGGNADASVTAVGSGTVSATASAVAGSGGENNNNPGTLGPAGTANAFASATGATAFANADTQGEGGTATAVAVMTGVGTSPLAAKAIAPAGVPGGVSSATTNAEVVTTALPGNPPTFSPGQHASGAGLLATSIAIAAPSTFYLGLVRLSSHPTVAQYLSQPANQITDLVYLETNYDFNDFSGTQHTYKSSVTFDPAAAPGKMLVLGLLDYSEYGFDLAPGNLQTIELTISEGTNTLLSNSFNNLSAAETFFTDNAIGLGAASGTTGPFTVQLSVTASGSGGFNIDLVTGTAASSPTPICFCSGTMIATPGGEVPVQRLKTGDSIITAAGLHRRIVWIGEGTVLATRGQRSAATPIIVRKGALADNVPCRDLRVTKAHSLLVDSVLIPVEYLVNHRSIIWDDRAQEVSIYHIELETHDVLIADGAAAESYRDDGNRWLFRNANSGWGLKPQNPCAPILTGGPIVDAVWSRLLDRSGPRPHLPRTTDADLHLQIDGQRIEAVRRVDASFVFRIPRGAQDVRIVSRAAIPCELGLSRDFRQLGVAVCSIVVRQGNGFYALDLQGPSLCEGFHAFEPELEIRWTDGCATIPISLLNAFDGDRELILHLGGTTSYLDDGLVQSAA